MFHNKNPSTDLCWDVCSLSFWQWHIDSSTRCIYYGDSRLKLGLYVGTWQYTKASFIVVQSSDVTTLWEMANSEKALIRRIDKSQFGISPSQTPLRAFLLWGAGPSAPFSETQDLPEFQIGVEESDQSWSEDTKSRLGQGPVFLNHEASSLL